MSQQKIQKLIISIISLIIIIVHRIFTLDVITIVFIIIGLSPWIMPYISTIIEKIKTPSGWEITFRNLSSSFEKIIPGGVKFSESIPFQPSYVDVLEIDPNLSLVGLRIEIEKRLRDLANKNGVKEHQPLRIIYRELQRKGVLEEIAAEGLDELITFGNKAAHGARVDKSAADWAIKQGPFILAALDEKLKD